MSGQDSGQYLGSSFQRSHCVVFSKGCPRIIDQHINGTKEQGRFLVEPSPHQLRW